ncbi:MAG TPA: fibronectin type III domain-containing protein, partial [Actinomycetota bacterium]|nr:fibronectin type III domain-containing protein [Actinomycetota bacterium]
GSAITGYTVTPFIGSAAQPSQSVGGSATQVAVNGLTNGTSYTFTVTANNGIGASAPSARSNAVSPAAPPGAPSAVVAVAGSGSASVSWSPPASNGGSPVTGYTITPAIGEVAQPPTSAGGSATSATITGLTNGTAYQFSVTAHNAQGSGPASQPSNVVTPAGTIDGGGGGGGGTNQGYWLVATDGGIFNYGNAGFFGSAGGIQLNKPIVGMAPTHDGKGYTLVASDGGIFNYGDAGFFGSAGSLRLNAPIVAMAATADGGGYWFVATDGGIFNYGDAAFLGSAGGQPLAKPVIDMVR